MQGAVFDGKNLIDAAADGPELEPAPTVHIAFVPSKNVEKYGNSGSSMKIPVYYSTSRERLLTEILIPSGADVTRWVLAGVGLFLSEPETQQQGSTRSMTSDNKK